MFVASGAVLPLADYPDSDAAPQAVADFFSDNRGGVLAGVIMNSLGSALFAVLAVGIAERLGDGWSRLGLGAALVSIAIFTTGFAGFVAAAYRVDAANPETVQLLADFAWATFAISSIGVTVSFGFYAVSIFSTGRLPAWLGWGTIVVAALHVIAGIAYAGSSGALSLEGEWAIFVPVAVYAWALAAGIAMVQLGGKRR
jgi:hypothetical protein